MNRHKCTSACWREHAFLVDHGWTLYDANPTTRTDAGGES